VGGRGRRPQRRQTRSRPQQLPEELLMRAHPSCVLWQLLRVYRSLLALSFFVSLS
jgi:organic hydroperoxide reductase OsmC/OhrA